VGDFASAFFADLDSRANDPRVRFVRGTLRLESIEPNSERWIVAFDNGRISVSHDDIDADCTVRGDRALMNRILTRDANPMTAILRGELNASGRLELLTYFQRLLP
jgi:predicted lipid carrier protein YhbT